METAPDLERFGSIARLYGGHALPRLHAAHVAVIGVGGVGSWTAEALARSGVGTITLVDLDDVCVTNTGRQLPALASTVGLPKVGVLAGRIREINPACRINAVAQFFTESTCDAILSEKFTWVIDAVDRFSIKRLIIGECRRRGIPVLTCGAAGGRRDPSRVRVTDLAQSGQDILLKQLRRGLRNVYGFPKGEGVEFGVPCVSTTEPPVYAWPDGTVRPEPPEECNLKLDCHSGFGAATFITGAFGFLAASEVVRRIAESTQEG
jgi:tRNA A37 threonylcarbamoyladenosine dehydratase